MKGRLTAIECEHAREVRAGRPANLFINRAAQVAWYDYVSARGKAEGIVSSNCRKDWSEEEHLKWSLWCDACGVPT